MKSGNSEFKHSEHKLIWDHIVYKCIQEVKAHSVNSEWLYIHTTVRIKERTTSHILNIKNPSWILRSKVKHVLLNSIHHSLTLKGSQSMFLHEFWVIRFKTMEVRHFRDKIWSSMKYTKNRSFRKVQLLLYISIPA